MLIPPVEALVVGDPLDETTDVATLISKAEVARVADWIDEAVAQGATLATGGRARRRPPAADGADRRRRTR